MKSLIRSIFLAPVFLVLVIGCGEQVKYQSTFRGSWILNSRKLPDGKVITPPSVTGLLQWFPISENQAHVIVAFTRNEESIQVLESIYQLEDQSFEQEEFVQIGGEYALEHQPKIAIERKTRQGRISQENGQITLTADGSKHVFNGAALTITHENGTVDSWQRSKDQKGMLTK